MKLLLSLLLLITMQPIFAQHVSCNTTAFTINGNVKANTTFDIKALDSFTAVPIPDVTITNHKGEVRRTITGLKGVLLKDILQKIEIDNDSPKTLSEFYLVFTACDGYKVVYSWNEIFNSATGNSIYIVKEKDGTNLSSITPSDIATGRRYVQSLASITIKRVQ
jgi:hypothetical protein